MAKQIVLKFGPYDRIVKQILKLAVSGISKKHIMEYFFLSGAQFRRLIAELQSGDLLRYHHTSGLFITSAKGNLYLKRSDDKNSIFARAGDIAKKMIMIDSNDTLFDARNTMLRYNISRVVVSDSGKVFGIVTENDIIRILYETPPTTGLNEIKLKSLLHKKLITIKENATIDACSRLMLKNNISSIIVTGNDGVEIGIITKTDLVELYAHHQSGISQVRECMQKKVQTVAPDETIHMIAMLMNTYNISRIVVKENKKPIGIVTKRDFIPISVRRSSTFQTHGISPKMKNSAKIHYKFMPRGIMAVVLAQDIMSHPLITVSANTKVSEAATLMIRNKISGLPVVNARGILMGIITKTDILNNKFIFINRILQSLGDY